MSRLARHLRSMRPSARLAWRDARAHKARTFLAIVLVALPLTVVLRFVAEPIAVMSPRDEALRALPAGVQAVVTGTATDPPEGTLVQDPEGPRESWINEHWLSEPNVTALDARRMENHLRQGNHAYQVIKSGRLLAGTDFQARLGTALPLSDGGAGDIANSELSRTSTPNLVEADYRALKLLLPKVLTGRLPTDGNGIVVTSALAKRLGVSPGDNIDLLAPTTAPAAHHLAFDGEVRRAATNAQVADVLHGSKRTYRVTGIVSSSSQLAWTVPGWLTEAAQASPTGYATTFVITGPKPVTWQDVKAFNRDKAFAVSRHVLTQYPDKAGLYPQRVYQADVLFDLVGLLVGVGAGAILLLGLITPAFRVGAQQQRRILGLTAAIGASPRHLERILTLQGMAMGAAGGILGSAGGLALLWLETLYTQPQQTLVYFPWWPVAVAIAATTATGWLATFIPARGAARTPPVESLRRSPRVAAKKTRPLPRTALYAMLLLLAAAACAFVSLRHAASISTNAIFEEIDRGSSLEEAYSAVTVETLPSLLAIIGIAVLGLTGCFMLMRVMLEVAAHRSLSSRMPPSVRLALREAFLHRGRTTPIIASVAVVVAFACAHMVEAASNSANQKDASGTMVAQGRVYLNSEVPINDAFDSVLMKDAAERLKREGLPVKDAKAVYSAGKLTLNVRRPKEAQCPDGQDVDAASALGRSKQIRCVPFDKAYNPSIELAWTVGDTKLLVMSSDALRATGLAGARQAADTLDRGGVVVGNAAMVDKAGKVQVNTAQATSGLTFRASADAGCDAVSASRASSKGGADSAGGASSKDAAVSAGGAGSAGRADSAGGASSKDAAVSAGGAGSAGRADSLGDADPKGGAGSANDDGGPLEAAGFQGASTNTQASAGSQGASASTRGAAASLASHGSPGQASLNSASRNSHHSASIGVTHTRQGHFLPRLNADLVVSPQTAKELGLTGQNAPVYVGAVISSTRPLTGEEIGRAHQVLTQHTGGMVVVRTTSDSPELGNARDYAVVSLFAMTALLALVFNLWLSRTQMREDLANMHAVGASPGFLRRTTAAYAATILAIGVPVGALAGWTFAVYRVMWNRNIALAGPWLRVEGAWGLQAFGLAILVAVALGLSWLVARPPRNPRRRRQD